MWYIYVVSINNVRVRRRMLYVAFLGSINLCAWMKWQPLFLDRVWDKEKNGKNPIQNCLEWTGQKFCTSCNNIWKSLTLQKNPFTAMISSHLDISYFEKKGSTRWDEKLIFWGNVLSILHKRFLWYCVPTYCKCHPKKLSLTVHIKSDLCLHWPHGGMNLH